MTERRHPSHYGKHHGCWSRMHRLMMREWCESSSYVDGRGDFHFTDWAAAAFWPHHTRPLEIDGHAYRRRQTNRRRNG